jgi:spore germination protein GerM
VNTPVPVPATPTRVITGRTLTVKAYMIARGDGGASGTKVGCGDSAVAVNRILPYTTTPLTDAMKELLTIHDQFYGQSGLYNALHSSRLQVASASLVGGVATIRLTGTTSLAGDCDDPRFEAQLKLTAMQFATVHVVNIYINGKPLSCVIGGKGC